MLFRASISLVFLLLFVWAQAQPPSSEKIDQSRLHFNSGVKAGIDEDFERAVEDFKKAIELNPLYAEAYLYKGLACIELEDYREAIRDFTITIELDPAFSDQAHYFRGLAWYYKEEYVKAIDDFSITIRMNPDHVVFYQRGKANLALGEYTRSLQDFNISLRLEDDFYDGYLYRGINLYYLEDFEEAKEDLEIAKEYLVDNPLAFYYSGLVRTALLNSYVAIEDLDRAIEMDPSFAPAYEARAQARSNTGNRQAAAEDLKLAEKAEKQKPAREHETPTGEPESTRQPESRPRKSTDLDFAELFGASAQDQEEPAKEDASTSANQPEQLVASGEEPKAGRAEPATTRQVEDFVDLESGVYNRDMSRVNPAGFGVQVASYSNTQNLSNLVDAYQEKYHELVFVNISQVNGRRIYRLIMGQFNERTAAENFRDTLRNQSFPDSFLVVFENL